MFASFRRIMFFFLTKVYYKFTCMFLKQSSKKECYGANPYTNPLRFFPLGNKDEDNNNNDNDDDDDDDDDNDNDNNKKRMNERKVKS